ncbi:MAG: hypothetical protein RB292_03755 [Patescibacteria group bacterium]|jgi:antitoxin component HigA of HigAB toxin-antitoxin module|nr:hypothetical protein [Patescibacteria group bacterium]
MRQGFENGLNLEKYDQEDTGEDGDEALCEKLANYLEKEKFFEFGSDGEVICDLDKISKQTDAIRALPDIESARKAGRSSFQKELLSYFQDKSVYSRSDWERKQSGEADIEPKPLFYIPSKDKAFDKTAIQDADFYLSISEVPGRWSSINQFYQEQFGYSGEEAELALRIFHPNYGAGYRDENGHLMVRKSSESKDFIPLNSDWITNKGIRSGGSGAVSGIKVASRGRTKSGGQIDIWAAPKRAINLPEYANLKKSGMLTAKDFNQCEGSKTSEDIRSEREIKDRVGGVSVQTRWQDEAGQIQSFSPRYILGSEFQGKLFVKLAEDLYGIVDETKGVRKVNHVFHPANPEQIQKRITEFEKKRGRKPKSGDIFFGKRDADAPKPVPFSATELSPRRQDETPEDYAQRVADFNAVREYNKLQELSRDLTEQAGLGIHNLSLREQNALTTYAFINQENYNQVIAFSKKFGLDGLRTFLACEYSDNVGNIIIEMGTKLPEEEAAEIFAEYNSLIKSAKHLAETINSTEEFTSSELFDSLREDFPAQCAEAIMRRAKDILYAAAAIAGKGKAKARFYERTKQLASGSSQEIIQSLKQYRLALDQIIALVETEDENESYQFELINVEEGVPESYNFSVEHNGQVSYLTIQLREYGVAYPDRNQQREFDSEARVNFLFSDRPIDLDIDSDSRKRALSLRIDREGKQRQDGKIVANDPTIKEGEISLEIGSVEDTVGRVISIGNALSTEAEQKNKNPQYYHNRESFSKGLGDAEVFAEIVRIIRRKIKEHYGSHHKALDLPAAA